MCSGTFSAPGMNSVNTVLSPNGKFESGQTIGGNRMLEASSMIKQPNGNVVTTGCSNAIKESDMEAEISTFDG